MFRSAIAATSLLSLAACATTVSEVPGTFTYRGDTYESVTRTFRRDDGSTYQRRTIFMGAERVSCRADDRRDCEAAVAARSVRDRSV